MAFEDIFKRVEWLDEQQRKSKTDIKDVAGRLAHFDSTATVLTQQLKTLAQQVGDLSLVAARIEQFDQMITKQRADWAKMVETLDKNTVRREQDIVKSHQADIEEIRKSVFQVTSTITAEVTVKKDLAREEQRRIAALQDLRAAVEAAARQTTETAEAQKALEENRRQEAKRLADLHGEVASVRKRADDAREKVALHTDSLRNLENRINELLETETGRKEEHGAVLQQVAMTQVERDRVWKEWQERFETFKQQAMNVESQVAAFDASVRAAQRAQEAYDGLNQRLERRIAEVGEIQRLAEERIRQEWVAFKADEQKRWTGHSLSQDEAVRDMRKDIEKIEQRLTTLDDAAQTLQDQLHQTTDTTEKQLQELMNLSQEWLSAYERIMGHAKTKAKKAVR